MDAKTFMGLERGDDDHHWSLPVGEHLVTPGNFLFGGCGLGAAVVALEEASGRPTIWATAQYLSHAKTHSTLDLEVTLAAQGGRVTQGRAVGRVGDNEILTVNAALGTSELELGGVWEHMPVVSKPQDCPLRRIPVEVQRSVFSLVETRVASGRTFEQLDGTLGSANSALWCRVPGHQEPSAGTLAVFGDFLSGAVAQPLGRRIMGRSLDNTIRIVQLEPTEWVLLDIRMHALVGGYAQGTAFMWSESGTLLATARQSLSIKLWPGDVA
jgi:acyl-CoA thioesterase